MVLNRSPWKPEEDLRLRNYIEAHGEGGWTTVAKKTGLLRSGKSCRLRWMNYLRPDLKHGNFLPDEEDLILRLHRLLGNRWSLIAGRVPGRTDNDIKNYWNTHLSKKLVVQGEDPRTHKPLSESRGIMSLTPGNRERSQMSKVENNCKKSEDIVDSRADLQHRAISDRVPPSSDPCPITPAAALGNFNTDIFPLLMELYVDEGLRYQEPGKDISVGHSVELWPLTQLEAATLTDDLWSNPTPSSHCHPFPWH